jgi:hypothetical protein
MKVLSVEFATQQKRATCAQEFRGEAGECRRGMSGISGAKTAQQIIVHEWPSRAFFEVVLPVESVYN